MNCICVCEAMVTTIGSGILLGFCEYSNDVPVLAARYSSCGYLGTDTAIYYLPSRLASFLAKTENDCVVFLQGLFGVFLSHLQYCIIRFCVVVVDKVTRSCELFLF